MTRTRVAELAGTDRLKADGGEVGGAVVNDHGAPVDVVGPLLLFAITLQKYWVEAVRNGANVWEVSVRPVTLCTKDEKSETVEICRLYESAPVAAFQEYTGY